MIWKQVELNLSIQEGYESTNTNEQHEWIVPAIVSGPSKALGDKDTYRYRWDKDTCVYIHGNSKEGALNVRFVNNSYSPPLSMPPARRPHSGTRPQACFLCESRYRVSQ